MDFLKTRIDIDHLVRTPQGLLVGLYAGVIVLGAVMLWLPWAHRAGQVDFLDALFTATSAVTLTGLTVLETGRVFTTFGQTVLLILMQLGGIAVMTFVVFLMRFLGARFTVESRWAFNSTFFQKQAGHDFFGALARVTMLTLLIEAIGMTAITLILLPRMRLGYAMFQALFHSVSAFCNAGLTLFSQSAAGFNSLPIFLVLMLLMLMGALGYPVVLEIGRRFRDILFKTPRDKRTPFSLHTRVAIAVSLVLLPAGFFGLLIFGLTGNEPSFFTKMGHALFTTVAARSGGLATLDFRLLPPASMLLLMVLMFVGGAPGSCAGGVHTNTIAVFFGHLYSVLKRRKDVALFDRSLPYDLFRRALLLLAMAIVWNLAGAFFLLALYGDREGVSVMGLLFEQISAFGNVGYSAGLAARLSWIGKLWIMATMFVGRLAPLVMATLALTTRTPVKDLPDDSVIVA